MFHARTILSGRKTVLLGPRLDYPTHPYTTGWGVTTGPVFWCDVDLKPSALMGHHRFGCASRGVRLVLLCPADR